MTRNGFLTATNLHTTPLFLVRLGGLRSSSGHTLYLHDLPCPSFLHRPPTITGPPSLTHSPTHALTHLLTHPLTHSPTPCNDDRVWDIRTGTEVKSVSLGAAVTSMELSRDGSVLTTTHGSTVRIPTYSPSYSSHQSDAFVSHAPLPLSHQCPLATSCSSSSHMCANNNTISNNNTPFARLLLDILAPTTPFSTPTPPPTTSTTTPAAIRRLRSGIRREWQKSRRRSARHQRT